MGKSLKYLSKKEKKFYNSGAKKNFFDKKFQGLLYKIDNLKNKKIRNKVAIINIESISKKIILIKQ